MSSVQEIEETIWHLTPSELEAFRAWFAEYDAELWDREMEADIAAGRLAHLAKEALRNLRGGRCTQLSDTTLRPASGSISAECPPRSNSWLALRSPFSRILI
jgi:hypothetical protein